LEEILKLSTEEKILIVEAVWDNIAEETLNKEISPETMKILEARDAEYEADKSIAAPWEEAKQRIDKALKR